MTLEKVSEIPPRKTPEGTVKGVYNMVTKMLREFRQSKDEFVDGQFAQEEDVSAVSLVNILHHTIRRNRMLIEVHRRGERVFLTQVPK